MVGVEHYKARADVIIQSFSDKIPDETTMHFMAYYSMLREHRKKKNLFFSSNICLGQFPHVDNSNSILLQIGNKI